MEQRVCVGLVAEGESARLASAARPVCLIRPVPTLVDGKL